MAGWIGVDLDGTLAHFDSWRGPRHIGLPIPAMAKRVHDWHEQGVEVRIFTARASRPELIPDVEQWLKRHGFPPLAVTNQKDFAMLELWDDRAVQVLYNTGKAVRPMNQQHIEKAALFDPDEEAGVGVAEDGASGGDAGPTAEAVEAFKRGIGASTDKSFESLDELLDALDDGDYTPGENTSIEDLIDAVDNGDQDDSDDTETSEPPPIESLKLDDSLPENSTGFLANVSAESFRRAGDTAQIEVELDKPAFAADDADDFPTLDDDQIEALAAADEAAQAARETSSSEDEAAAPVDATSEDLDGHTDGEDIGDATDPALDNTLDDQPVGEISALDSLDDLDDLDAELDDLPDDLRSAPNRPIDDNPLAFHAAPADELDDLDDLPSLRVERR